MTHPLTDEICIDLGCGPERNDWYVTDMRAAYDLAIEHFFKWIIEDEDIRIDAQGFHYRGQCIEDAGEAHHLLVEFLRKQQENK